MAVQGWIWLHRWRSNLLLLRQLGVSVFALTELFPDTKKERENMQLLTFLLKCWLTIWKDDNQSCAHPIFCLVKQSNKPQYCVAMQGWCVSLIHTKGILPWNNISSAEKHTRPDVAYPFSLEKVYSRKMWKNREKHMQLSSVVWNNNVFKFSSLFLTF